MKSKVKIGPIPAAAPNAPDEPELTPEIFRVDKTAPEQQSLAKRRGWPFLESLEQANLQPDDLQRGPFDRPKRGLKIEKR